MRNLDVLKLSILLLLSILVFDSCKKGADDPLISFRSRNNRICAKWKLDSGTGKFTTTSTTTSARELGYSYSGSDFTTTAIGQDGTQTIITYIAYNFQMELDKNNIIKYTETYNLNGVFNSISINGYWYWLDDKKKTMINIPLSSTDAFDFDNWEVTELKHNQITLKYSITSTVLGVTETDDRELVFSNLEK